MTWRVMITGGESMIGRAVYDHLAKNCGEIDLVPHAQCDLLDIEQV